LDVRREKLEDAGFAEASFDVVTLFGVLEHLKNPHEQLQLIHRLLRPGGAVMAIVPNAASLAAMVLHDRARMFSGYNHLTYFTLDTLAAIFERNGYKARHLDTVLTGLDSILNYFQFTDPQGPPVLQLLPSRWRDRLATEEGRWEVERSIQQFDLGLRARVVAVKPV
jgi:SAM-dependent methyltransferase